MMKIKGFATEKGTSVIGPNTLGVVTVGQSKIKALSQANISIAQVPWEIGKLMREALN